MKRRKSTVGVREQCYNKTYNIGESDGILSERIQGINFSGAVICAILLRAPTRIISTSLRIFPLEVNYF